MNSYYLQELTNRQLRIAVDRALDPQAEAVVRMGDQRLPGSVASAATPHNARICQVDEEMSNIYSSD